MSVAIPVRLTRHGRRRRSTCPWLKTVPEHWREAKLTLVARLGSGHTPSRSRPDWWQNCTIPWITTGEVAQMRNDRIEYLTETREMISEAGVANSSAAVHPAGTVVLSRTASAGYSAIMATDMATSQDFATWTCGTQLSPRFLLLCLRAMRQDLLERLAMGSTHQTIYMPDIESIRIPVPPIDEQAEIVDRVWTELHRTDALIEAKQQMIDAARRRLRSLAVTLMLRGLDPIHGGGNIPDGWRTAELGRVILLQRGHDLPTDARVDGDVPVISSGGISGYHNAAAAEGPGVVTGRYGTIGEVYFSAVGYWPLNTTLYVKDFRGAEPCWVYWLLRCLPLEVDGEKSAVGGINRNVIGKIRVSVPPRDVQRQIATTLDRLHASCEELADTLTDQLDLLRERRQALITAAVTGELEVA